jgi:hypothetical protein
MLDTCVLLDISTRKNDLPIVSALEKLISSGVLKLVVPDVVIVEFNRHKDTIADKTRQRLSQEFKQVRNVVHEFGGVEKEKAIEILNEVSSRLPLLSEANYATVSRVEKLIGNSFQVNISDSAKILAVQRGLDKKAPFHLSKNSMADAVIIEQFSEFILNYDSGDNDFIFVTHNHNDFSSKDHRKPHEDFSDIFQKDNVHYFNNASSAIKIVDDEILEDMQFEYDFTEETRGLREILSVMDELVDKVWYNRHCNRLVDIENGDIRIVPDGTKKYGNNVIHESIWKGAQKSAQRVADKYDDVGPWDDFEWGMLNGKLSALRWVLGDEWDMLDT